MASTSLPSPTLVIDGSQTAVFAGVLGTGGAWLAQSEAPGTPLERLFPAVRRVLGESGHALGDLRSFAYCRGPGSVLGLRLSAMALETWRRTAGTPPALYGYNSMALTAALLARDRAPGNALLVADWKKGAWHAVRFEAGAFRPPEAIGDEVLAARDGPLYHLPQRKGWQSPPPGAIRLDYQPERLPEILAEDGILAPTSAVELDDGGGPAFQKWTPERHRA